jgi:hypothetical protein
MNPAEPQCQTGGQLASDIDNFVTVWPLRRQDRHTVDMLNREESIIYGSEDAEYSLQSVRIVRQFATRECGDVPRDRA